MLPSPQLLNKIENFIKQKGKFSYFCLFLLGKNSSLRVSEAVNFDLSLKKSSNLYLIQGKRHKKRAVFVDSQVNNWKPNKTNRFSYAHFLQKTKKELNISPNIELTPHTLRRCFATYQANSGMTLPVLQQVLGHSSIRTTSLYWKSTQEPWEKVISNKWLDGKLPPEPPKPAEIKPKEQLSVFINIHQEINIFILNNSKNSEQKLLTAKNQLLQAKLKQLEQENNEKNKVIDNLQNNLQKALNDKQKTEELLAQTQKDKKNLLKLLSVELQKQQQNLLQQESKNRSIPELHRQLIAQIEIKSW